jgi:thioredoxin 1
MKKTILGTILAIFCIAPLSALAAELPSSNEAAVKAALTSGKPTVADFGARSLFPVKKWRRSWKS